MLRIGLTDHIEGPRHQPSQEIYELLSNAVDGIDQAATALMPSTNRIP
jgi:hypothetical protein